jgi:hypothetical protein
MPTDVVSLDGCVVHFPAHAVSACATLVHVTQHCTAGTVPVPFVADTLERFLAALAGGGVTDGHVPELLLVADYLDCAALMQPLCRRLAGADLTGHDFSLELWSCITEHMALPAGCSLALQRPELTDILRPRLVALAKNVTLQSAAADGHLAVCEWLTQELGLTAQDARSGNNYPLRHAAINGHLAVCQWLTERFGLTADDACSLDNHALCVAASRGRLGVCQWLTERFGLTADDARSANRFNLECVGDAPPVRQWLTEHPGVSITIPTCHNYALHYAAGNGHLAMCKWLTKRFGLTAEDARADNSGALRDAAIHGHLAVCKWLVRRFRLTAVDARRLHNRAFCVAAGGGHLAVCQWLVRRFKLTADDARSRDNFALRNAVANGHLAVCHWLTERFGLTADDASRAVNFVYLRDNGDRVAVEWLMERFGLKTPAEVEVRVVCRTLNFLRIRRVYPV